MDCRWCDAEFDTDDWIDDGERQCEECDCQFCSEQCQREHTDENHKEAS